MWAVSESTGRSLPIDAAPDPAGLVELTGETTKPYGAPVVRVHGQPDLLSDGERYTSHFATCPDADSWRKPRE